MDCGAAANAQAADDLPPTVVGFQPSFAPNQFQAQNQPQPPPQNQPNFAPPAAAFPMNASAKSKKGLIIGGIVGLLMMLVGAGVLAIAFVIPYFTEQSRLKSAVSTTATSLVPVEFITSEPKNPRTFQQSKTYDKMQLLQASQNLPPELKSEIKDITDAAAAEYTDVVDANRKVPLQIFKFSSPEIAFQKCQKISDALGDTQNQSNLEVSPTYCRVMVNKGDNISVITSLYGFLIVSAGKRHDAVAAEMWAFDKLRD